MSRKVFVRGRWMFFRASGSERSETSFFSTILKKWCVILNELRRGYGKTSSRKKTLSLKECQHLWKEIHRKLCGELLL